MQRFGYSILLCRQGDANYLPDSLLQTPLKTEEIFKVILESEEKGFIKSLYAKVYLELYAFKMIRLRYGRRTHRVEQTKSSDSTTISTASSVSDTIILVFDDVHQENEIVYSIAVNHHENMW
jgi:hypothetical protein